MSTDGTGLVRFGGIALIVSGVLFLTQYLLEIRAGPPPSVGAEIITWVQANRLALSLVNEVLFFASVSLVPAVIALYVRLGRVEPTLTAVGCGLIAVVIPIVAVLLIVQGRLVYPVYGLHISDPAVAELVVALFYGGLHAVGLLMAAATCALSLAMRRAAFGGSAVALGFATAVGDTVGAYPYLINPMVLFACQLLFTAWFIVVGWKLCRTDTRGVPK